MGCWFSNFNSISFTLGEFCRTTQFEVQVELFPVSCMPGYKELKLTKKPFTSLALRGLLF